MCPGATPPRAGPGSPHARGRVAQLQDPVAAGGEEVAGGTEDDRTYGHLAAAGRSLGLGQGELHGCRRSHGRHQGDEGEGPAAGAGALLGLVLGASAKVIARLRALGGRWSSRASNRTEPPGGNDGCGASTRRALSSLPASSSTARPDRRYLSPLEGGIVNHAGHHEGRLAVVGGPRRGEIAKLQRRPGDHRHAEPAVDRGRCREGGADLLTPDNACGHDQKDQEAEQPAATGGAARPYACQRRRRQGRRIELHILNARGKGRQGFGGERLGPDQLGGRDHEPTMRAPGTAHRLPRLAQARRGDPVLGLTIWAGNDHGSARRRRLQRGCSRNG